MFILVVIKHLMFIISDLFIKMNVCVEASIGMGKTTLIRNLENMIKGTHKVEILTEPVQLWRNVAGRDLLQLFGSDPVKFAFQTQVHIISTMAQQRQFKDEVEFRICERSIDASEHIFKPVLSEDGFITEIESSILTDLYLTLKSRMPETNAIIYLKGSADLAKMRIKDRQFECDEQLPLAYLENLQRKHDEYIESKIVDGMKVLTINAAKDASDVALEAFKFIMEYVG